MAHYLHRKFHRNPEVCVLHQLRIEDANQPEQDGSTGVCQIDHLVVHRLGFFLVESKSVIEAVQVRPDGEGGDEWSRTYRGQQKGMPSPIRQANRQSEFLRAVLQRNRTELVGRRVFGGRTIAKVIHGTDQRGFLNAPMQLVIAVSDGGRIRRLDGWKPPQKPFRVFVSKADAVPDQIDKELDRHRKGANLLNLRPVGEYSLWSMYGLWSMQAEEVPRVGEFLASRHMDSAVALTLPAARQDSVAKSDGLRKIRKRFPNAYEPWSQADDRELCQLHEDGWSDRKLADRFGRKPSAINARLQKLGRG